MASKWTLPRRGSLIIPLAASQRPQTLTLAVPEEVEAVQIRGLSVWAESVEIEGAGLSAVDFLQTPLGLWAHLGVAAPDSGCEVSVTMPAARFSRELVVRACGRAVKGREGVRFSGVRGPRRVFQPETPDLADFDHEQFAEAFAANPEKVLMALSRLPSKLRCEMVVAIMEHLSTKPGPTTPKLAPLLLFLSSKQSAICDS